MMKSIKKDLLKIGVGIIVAAGIGTIIGNAIKVTTPSNLKAMAKLGVALGKLVLVGVATDAATNYICEQIDDSEAIIVGAAQMAKEVKENEQNNND